MEAQQRLTRRYDIEAGGQEGVKAEELEPGQPKDHSQPILFHGRLKNYQLKGMNWLLNLYDQVQMLKNYFFEGTIAVVDLLTLATLVNVTPQTYKKDRLTNGMYLPWVM
jgi:hypothetical protein